MNKNKNPWIAGALNIVPGLGYLYLGIRKVFALLLLSTVVISGADYFINENVRAWLDSEPFTVLTYILYFVAFLAFMYDAYAEAKSRNV